MFEGKLLIKNRAGKKKECQKLESKKERIVRSKNQKSKAARNRNRKKRKTVKIKILILKKV